MTHFEQIRTEFTSMVKSGTMPIFEYPTNIDEYLVVEINVFDDGVFFELSFGEEYETRFNGFIKPCTGGFIIPIKYINEMEPSLYNILCIIHENVMDGFLAVNNLFKNEE